VAARRNARRCEKPHIYWRFLQFAPVLPLRGTGAGVFAADVWKAKGKNVAKFSAPPRPGFRSPPSAADHGFSGFGVSQIC